MLSWRRRALGLQPLADLLAAGACCLPLLWAGAAAAADQGADGGEAEEQAPVRRNIPLLSARYLYAGSTELAPEQAGPAVHFDHHTVRVEGMAGHMFRDSGTIVAGSLRYNVAPVRYKFGDEQAERVTFHGFYGRLSLLQRLDDHWGSLGFLRVGVASDFRGIAWSDLGMSTGAAITYRVSERLQLAAGALFTNAFVNELVLPLLRLRYAGDSFRCQLMVPRGIDAWYAPVAWFEVGFAVAALAQRYGVHEQQRLGDRYARLDIKVGPAVRFYVHGGWFMGAEGGYDVRHVRLFRREAVTHSLLDFAGGYAELSAGYMY